MQTVTPEQVICDYQNDNFKRNWEIEVQCAKNVFGRQVRINISSGDILKAAQVLSKSFPTEETVVRGLNTLRAIFKNGEIVKDFKHFGEKIEDTQDRYIWETFQEFLKKERNYNEK